MTSGASRPVPATGAITTTAFRAMSTRPEYATSCASTAIPGKTHRQMPPARSTFWTWLLNPKPLQRSSRLVQEPESVGIGHVHVVYPGVADTEDLSRLLLRGSFQIAT